MHEVYYGQGTLRARDQAREAAGARQGDERDDDQDANDPEARQGDERDNDHDAIDPGARQDNDRDNDQDAIDPRRDIQARIRRAPNVIIADTYANRPHRTRSTIDKYQAGTRKVTKKLGRGRGRGRGGGGV